VSERWVINASPMIVLCRIGLQGVIFDLTDEVLLPRAGETAVLTFALVNSGWTAILDDGAARKCARSFAIPHKGTLAIVILAKPRGLIASAADAIRNLQQGGFRINDHIVREAPRRTVGEEWQG